MANSSHIRKQLGNGFTYASFDGEYITIVQPGGQIQLSPREASGLADFLMEVAVRILGEDDGNGK